MTQNPATASGAAPAPAQKEVHERRGLLTFGGVLLLLMAILFLMLVPLMLLGAMLTPPQPETPVLSSNTVTISTALTYAGLDVFFGALGLGSIRGQRWVRPLMLATGWMWLLFGAIGVLVMYLTLPRMMEAIAASADQPLPPEVQGIVVAAALTFFALLGIVLPAFLLLVYSARGVRLALERSQPTPSRLEQVPVSVLTLAVAFAAAAFTGLTTAIWFPAMPLFAWVLTGWPATLLQLATAAASGWIAWQLFQRRMAGWWGTVAITVFFAASLLMTGRQGLERTYLAMGLSQAEVAELMSFPMLQQPLLWYGTLFALLAGYMVYIRRYFAEEA